jgi:hypothetical protein
MSSRCRRVQSDQLLEKLTEILLCGLSEGLTADLVIGGSFVRVHKSHRVVCASHVLYLAV